MGIGRADGGVEDSWYELREAVKEWQAARRAFCASDAASGSPERKLLWDRLAYAEYRLAQL